MKKQIGIVALAVGMGYLTYLATNQAPDIKVPDVEPKPVQPKPKEPKQPKPLRP